MSDAASSQSRNRMTRRGVLDTALALGALTALPAAPAVAQSQKLVVTTMPGPRWEGALRASAAAYRWPTQVSRSRFSSSPYAEHYQRIGTSLIENSGDFDLHLFDPVLIGQSYPKLAPLKDLFDTDPQWRDYYENGVPYFYRGSWDWNGIPYAVVHDANCMMTWWRSDVFEQFGLAEPATFETVLRTPRTSTRRRRTAAS